LPALYYWLYVQQCPIVLPQGAPDLFQHLNPRQREAATSHSHPLLIIAGAGTGKTNTLAHRVAHLVLKEWCWK
jgi:hypothetical protein